MSHSKSGRGTAEAVKTPLGGGGGRADERHGRRWRRSGRTTAETNLAFGLSNQGLKPGARAGRPVLGLKARGPGPEGIHTMAELMKLSLTYVKLTMTYIST